MTSLSLLAGRTVRLFSPSVAFIQKVHFRLNSIMEANYMNPDRTAPMGVWSGSILFAFFLPKKLAEIGSVLMPFAHIERSLYTYNSINPDHSATLGAV